MSQISVFQKFLNIGLELAKIPDPFWDILAEQTRIVLALQRQPESWDETWTTDDHGEYIRHGEEARKGMLKFFTLASALAPLVDLHFKETYSLEEIKSTIDGEPAEEPALQKLQLEFDIYTASAADDETFLARIHEEALEEHVRRRGLPLMEPYPVPTGKRG